MPGVADIQVLNENESVRDFVRQVMNLNEPPAYLNVCQYVNEYNEKVKYHAQLERMTAEINKVNEDLQALKTKAEEYIAKMN